MKKPLISIITPVYNHEKYIKKCIESAINQSFTDWEMLIIDDASTDRTANIIDYYVSRDKRIRCIAHKYNWGAKNLIKTYNQSLKLAKGKYLAILESDDYWPKNKLQAQLPFLNKKTPFSFGNCIVVDRYGLPIDYVSYDYQKTLPKSIYLSTVVLNKESLKKIGGFVQDKKHFFCDVPTIQKLAKLGDYKYIPMALSYYRRQPTSNWYKFEGKDRNFLSRICRSLYYQTMFKAGFIFYPRYLSKYLMFQFKNILYLNNGEQP